MCDECLILNSQSEKQSPKRKNNTNKSTKQSTINAAKGTISLSLTSNSAPGVSKTPDTCVSNSVIDQTKKIDQFKKTLTLVVSKIEDQTKTIEHQTKTIDEQTKTIDSLKNSIDTMQTSVNDSSGSMNQTSSATKSLIEKIEKQSYAQTVSSNMVKQVTRASNPSGTSTNRPIDLETKKKIKERPLTAGTDDANTHGLGAPVIFNRRRENNQRDILTKSIYVSRLQTKVTVDDITSYIKERLPDTNNEHFSLRLLVKKDQTLDDLTFISYRLSCTEDLYNTLVCPSFWPQHVLIGEFYEKPRDRKTLVAEFITSENKTNTPNNEKTPKNVKSMQGPATNAIASTSTAPQVIQ